jgi:hypothetical protein
VNAINIVEGGLNAGKWFLGLAAAIAAAIWLQPPDDVAAWGWSAFGSFSAMAGFMLAAIALGQAACGLPALDGPTRSPAWSNLLGCLSQSMWLWMLAGLAGLAACVVPAPVSVPLLAGTATLAACEGLRAMIWVSAVVTAFQRHLSGH